MTGLIEITIRNFKGVVSFRATPGGKSLTLQGKNGAGKTSVIDGLFWGLGGNLDGEVVRNGSERAEVELVFGDYLVTRKQSKGKRPTLEVKSADGKAKFTSPTALLAGFIGAIERRTFSTRKSTERAEILRKLAPGLDVSDLDGERASVYEERTQVNREAKTLRAQAEGVVIPEAPAQIPEERPIVDVVDVAAIAERKAEVAQGKAANEEQRRTARRLRQQADDACAAEHRAHGAVEAARQALARAEAALEEASRAAVEAQERAQKAEGEAAALVDPDATEIDRQIAEAREQNRQARAEAEAHNRAVREALAKRAEAARALAERDRLAGAAAAKEESSKRLTARIDELDAEKAARIAAAKCPIPGLVLAGDAVLFDDGTHGPVEIDALNTGSRMRLDVEIAAALGHRLIAVRDASLLDAGARASLAALAAARKVQLLSEIVGAGEQVTAEIEEGEAHEVAALPLPTPAPVALDDEI